MMPKTLCVLSSAVVLVGPWMLFSQEPPPAGLRLRRPIALALVGDGKRLVVANRDSGTIQLLDTRARQVIGEKRVARKLSDLRVLSNGMQFLATDEAAGEVVVLSIDGATLQETRRIKVGMSPVSVQASNDGSVASVALLWARQLAILDLVNSASAGVTLDLPFAPRQQIRVPGQDKVIVADAFAGQLAVVDLRRRKFESVRNLPVHNIRGLSFDRELKSLYLTHQSLPRSGRTTPGDITSGNAVSNNVRKLDLAAVLDPWADLLRDDRLYQVGDVERGAGDPAALAAFANGSVLVALAGVDEVALGQPETVTWTRLPVGARPTALAVDDAQQLAYVANTFSDSISVVDLKTPKVVAEIRLGPLPELRSEERGEQLFHDARLSLDAWYSCHSCHTDGHTSGRLNDNFTDGSFGTPKRVLSLLGVKDTAPYAWSGQVPDLETQIRTSLKSTMQGKKPTPEQVTDLAAYLRTLAPPPSLAQARAIQNPKSVALGRQVFIRHKCAACHAPPTFTSAKTYDVSLSDELGGKQFNPPSLRGVSQSGPYFHDGRAATLDEVFKRYGHPPTEMLSPPELHDLLQYLRSL